MGRKFLWLQFEIETPNVNTLSDIIITDITCTLEAWASVKIKSVKLMSVNDKVRNNIGQFQCGFSGISDLRSVDCLKMTSHNGIVDNESKTIILDT